MSLFLPIRTWPAGAPVTLAAGRILITAKPWKHLDVSIHLQNASELCSGSYGPQQNWGWGGVGRIHGAGWKSCPVTLREGCVPSELHGLTWKVSLPPPRRDARQLWVSPRPRFSREENRASVGCAFRCQENQPPPWPVDQGSPW